MSQKRETMSGKPESQTTRAVRRYYSICVFILGLVPKKLREDLLEMHKLK
jgi:hypothetical protein